MKQPKQQEQQPHHHHQQEQPAEHTQVRRRHASLCLLPHSPHAAAAELTAVPPLLQADAQHQASSHQLSQEELEFISTLNEVGGSRCGCVPRPAQSAAPAAACCSLPPTHTAQREQPHMFCICCCAAPLHCMHASSQRPGISPDIIDLEVAGVNSGRS